MSSYFTLQGSQREHPEHSMPAGLPPADQIISLKLILRRRNAAPDCSALGQQLSYSELTERHGADPADIRTIEVFTTEHQLVIEHVNVAARSVSISGQLCRIAPAFGADLELRQIHDQTKRVRRGSLTLPESLKDIVVAVLGFDERPVATTNHYVQKRARQSLSYTPPQLAQIYNFPQNTGKNQTIALIELDGGFVSSDLNSYWKQIGVNPVSVSAISVGGAQNNATGDLNGPDGEVALDIEVAGGVAPNAAIAVYFAPNTDQGFLAAIHSAVHDQVRRPSVISISWGAPESGWTVQSMNAFNAAFHDAALLGISVCVASGDNGSSDGLSDGKSHVDFPASSPWVLACGGTNLVANNSRIIAETVWNDGTNGGASGGGVSGHFSCPWYQRFTHLPTATGSKVLAGRGIPDVSANADPATGYVVLVDGTPSVIGGTSAVAPLWAGLIALMNEELGTNVGFFHWNLYSHIKDANALHDIASGTNGSYVSARGWDACTGLGSPNGQAILAVLKSLSGK